MQCGNFCICNRAGTGLFEFCKKAVQMQNINRNKSTDKEESICCILNDDFGWDSDLGMTLEIRIF